MMSETGSASHSSPSCTFTLEWFETGRTELLRSVGKPYREMESLGVMLPVREAHVEYLGRAQYDDLLRLTARMSKASRTQVRVDVEIQQADSGEPVCRGWTVHVVTNRQGRPIRPPAWFAKLFEDVE